MRARLSFSGEIVSVWLFERQAACGVLFDFFDIQEQKAEEQPEHHKEDDKAVPDVLHRVDPHDARGEKHGKGVCDGSRKTKTAGNDRGEKTGKGIVSEQKAKRRYDREHGQHFFKEPEECAKAIEQKGNKAEE